MKNVSVLHFELLKYFKRKNYVYIFTCYCAQILSIKKCVWAMHVLSFYIGIKISFYAKLYERTYIIEMYIQFFKKRLKI
jgi:hypothetical protein